MQPPPEVLTRALSACPNLEIDLDDEGCRIRQLEPKMQFYHSFVSGPLPRRARQKNQALLKACQNRQKTK